MRERLWRVKGRENAAEHTRGKEQKPLRQ